MNIQVLPAIMPGSYTELEGWVRKFDGIVPWIQIDVMDGVFVPVRGWPYNQTNSEPWTAGSVQLPKTETLSYEVHLMVQDPETIGFACVHAGARRIIVHVESFADVRQTRACLQTLHNCGAEVGVALLLETPLDTVYPFINEGLVSVVQLMSITPIGVQGNALSERVFGRIETLRQHYPTLTIAVDGGVKKENALALVHAGATHLGVGSAIVKSPDPAAAYQEICATL